MLGGENSIDGDVFSGMGGGEEVVENLFAAERANLLAFVEREAGGKDTPGPVVGRAAERRGAPSGFYFEWYVVGGGEECVELVEIVGWRPRGSGEYGRNG